MCDVQFSHLKKDLANVKPIFFSGIECTGSHFAYEFDKLYTIPPEYQLKSFIIPETFTVTFFTNGNMKHEYDHVFKEAYLDNTQTEVVKWLGEQRGRKVKCTKMLDEAIGFMVQKQSVPYEKQLQLSCQNKDVSKFYSRTADDCKRLDQPTKVAESFSFSSIILWIMLMLSILFLFLWYRRSKKINRGKINGFQRKTYLRP